MTDTPQPDPQVVARCQRHGGAAPCIYCMSLHAAGFLPPLTVADIPAGQGPASLYVDEYGVVRYRAASGLSAVIPAGWIPRDIDERDALNAALDHLAAILPHVATEGDK